MKESVEWTFSQLIICLLNLTGPQLNRVVQVLTGHCNLKDKRKLQVVLSFLHVQSAAERKKHETIWLQAIASFINKTTVTMQQLLLWTQMRPIQCVSGLYLKVADSLAPLPNCPLVIKMISSLLQINKKEEIVEMLILSNTQCNKPTASLLQLQPNNNGSRPIWTKQVNYIEILTKA